MHQISQNVQHILQSYHYNCSGVLWQFQFLVPLGQMLFFEDMLGEGPGFSSKSKKMLVMVMLGVLV